MGGKKKDWSGGLEAFRKKAMESEDVLNINCKSLVDFINEFFAHEYGSTFRKIKAFFEHALPDRKRANAHDLCDRISSVISSLQLFETIKGQLEDGMDEDKSIAIVKKNINSSSKKSLASFVDEIEDFKTNGITATLREFELFKLAGLCEKHSLKQVLSNILSGLESQRTP